MAIVCESAATLRRRDEHSHCRGGKGLLRELNPGPLAPEARIIPLDQAANETKAFISKAQANVNKMGRIA